MVEKLLLHFLLPWHRAKREVMNKQQQGSEALKQKMQVMWKREEKAELADICAEGKKGF